MAEGRDSVQGAAESRIPMIVSVDDHVVEPQVATEMFAGLDDDTVYKIVRGNALPMLELTD